MPKANGLVTWKSFALFITIGGVILVGCWGYAASAKAHAQRNEIKAVEVRARTDGLQDDLNDFRSEQRQWNAKTEAKLDKILERLP